jgi:CheY-like chemotaxis protein
MKVPNTSANWAVKCLSIANRQGNPHAGNPPLFVIRTESDLRRSCVTTNGPCSSSKTTCTAKQLRWSFDQYETLTAADRESALVQIHRHSPAVVTMDLGLPPMRTRFPKVSACSRKSSLPPRTPR